MVQTLGVAKKSSALQKFRPSNPALRLLRLVSPWFVGPKWGDIPFSPSASLVRHVLPEVWWMIAHYSWFTLKRQHWSASIYSAGYLLMAFATSRLLSAGSRATGMHHEVLYSTESGAVDSEWFWQSKNIYTLAVGQNLVPLVNIKIAGKWMFIPLKKGINRYWSIPIYIHWQVEWLVKSLTMPRVAQQRPRPDLQWCCHAHNDTAQHTHCGIYRFDRSEVK